jgi:type IV secretion system protein VirD4
MEGADPFMTGLGMRQQAYEEQHRTKQRRMLQTPDEVMNAKPGSQFIFADSVGKPILASRAPYYEQVFMAGRYHPNPYHPPANKVRVKTKLGHTMRNVKHKRVPKRYADYPQYAHGMWSCV